MSKETTSIVVSNSPATLIPDLAKEWLKKNSKHDFSKEDEHDPSMEARTHPDFIRMAKELDFSNNDSISIFQPKYVIIKVPKEIGIENLQVDSEEGSEWVEEKHEQWHYSERTNSTYTMTEFLKQ